MPETPIVNSLLALLQEQRREVATRSVQERGSEGWDASCERLDRINERIMRSGDDGSVGRIVVKPLSAHPDRPADR